MNKAYEVADRLMEWVSSLLHRITGEPSPVWDRIVYGILVFVIAIVVARILRMIVIYVIHRIIKYKGGDLLKGLVEAKVFTHITHVIPPLVILSLLPFAFHGTPELLRIIEKVCWIYLLGVLVFSINTQISVFWRIYSRRTAFRDRPMKGMIQIIKGLLIGIWVIIAVSILIERSPMALITGLGAFAAVLMLIFKDSILGFVAGVQRSQNDMIRNGDWIVVPGGAVNGVVIDVSLNTVKVQNFDNTIVTIPPYSLISGEVQNWRGMSDSGGRRIMRSFTIDLNTVKFCTPELLQNLKQIDILRDFIEKKEAQQQKGIVENTENSAGLVNGTIEMLFVRKILHWMKRYPRLGRLAVSLERRADRKSSRVRKSELVGLCILVAIPLPGTGAWTGALVAALMEMRLKRALPAIYAGVLIAGLLVTLALTGVKALRFLA